MFGVCNFSHMVTNAALEKEFGKIKLLISFNKYFNGMFVCLYAFT